MVDTFTETLTVNNKDTVAYQVSTDDGTTWNYWTGAACVTSTQTDGIETSAANDINTNIATLDTDGGDFSRRAYLTSDGSQKVELDQVNVVFLLVQHYIYMRHGKKVSNGVEESMKF